MAKHRNFLLRDIGGIKIGEALITPEDLKRDWDEWYGIYLSPGVGKDGFELSDEEILRMLYFEATPLTLWGQGRCILRAELVRFPYSINGEMFFHMFAHRLFPESGNISRIEMCGQHENFGTAVFDRKHMEIDAIESTRLEIFFDPQKVEELEPLRPPTGYRKEVTTST